MGKNITEKELRQISKELSKDSREYKRLIKRSFRKYSNYEDFKEIARTVAAHLGTIDLALDRGLKLNDPTWINVSHAMFGLYREPNFPIYALKEELLEAFLNSDPPKNIWEMPIPFERAIVVLPKGRLKNPDGLSVNWLIIDFLESEKLETENKQYWEYIQSKSLTAKYSLQASYFQETGGCLRMRWSTVAELQFSYSSVRAMPKHGQESPYKTYDFLKTQISDNEIKEKKFTEEITGLVSLLIIFLTRPRYQTQLLENNLPKGFNSPTRKRRNDPKSPSNYIMIGENFKIKRTHQGGTHASPEPHYRRGHCRFLPWREPGDQEIWVPPTWVGG